MMKKNIVSIFLLTCAFISQVQGQTAHLSKKEQSQVNNQLYSKFEKFAKIVEDVGTTNSGLTKDEKQSLIVGDAPTLFYDYPKRFMTVTNAGRNPSRKQMSAYLRNLMDQSLSEKYVRSYDLELMSWYEDGDINEKWHFYRLTNHGDSVYQKKIRFRQRYIRIDLFKQKNERQNYTYEEVEEKDMDIYLIKAKTANVRKRIPTLKLGNVHSKERK